MDLKNMGLEPLESLPSRMSLGQHIFAHLKKAILRGDVPPGRRVVENRMAKALGISRTPVREAFHKLEREGLIRLTPQGGYVVTGLSKEDIEDIFGIRGVLESYAAGLAALHHNEADLLLLMRKNEEAERCLREEKLQELPRINTEFHEILHSMTGRPKLIEIINNLQAQVYRFRKIILCERKYAEVSLKAHRDLVTALKKRDSSRAEELIRNHILRGQRIVLTALEKEKGEF